jgi:hypothetical protein
MTRGRFYQPYTVGDMDRVAFMRRNRMYTVEDVSRKLEGTALAASPSRLRELARAFKLDIRKSLYEAAN